MTTAPTRVGRSGAAIRAALAEHLPDECAAFEEEVRESLEQAGRTLDLAPVDAALDRWWGVAAIRANPLSDDEQAQVARARGGNAVGLLVQDDHGDWDDSEVARYGPVWLEIARDQYLGLEVDVQAEVDARLEELLETPDDLPGAAYDRPTDQWTTTYGPGTGLILFAVVPERRKPIVQRLV